MRITIENLPPIATGSFELRPLTIFIGPNNTGKSRAATFAYCLARALGGPWGSPIYARADKEGYIAFDREAVAKEVEDHYRECVEGWLPRLLGEYLDIGGARVDGSQPTRTTHLNVQTGEDFSISLDAGPQVRVETSGINAFERLGKFHENQLRLSNGRQHFIEAASFPFAYAAWNLVLRDVGLPNGASYYMPAARGALAGVWSWYANLAVAQAGTNESSELLPALPRDFLQALLRGASRLAAGRTGDAALTSAVDLLEQDVLEGRIGVAGNQSLPFPLIYSGNGATPKEAVVIDIARASSSVNELGPVAVILKTLVKSGDLVVIDEPEAHLHPENHRLIAHLLVRLAAAGVTVIAPTHSSTIIHQVSNLVRAHQLDADSKRRLGLADDDTLPRELVGVYDFNNVGNNVTIEEVTFDEDYGYPEEQFFDVALALNRETSNIDMAATG